MPPVVDWHLLLLGDQSSRPWLRLRLQAGSSSCSLQPDLLATTPCAHGCQCYAAMPLLRAVNLIEAEAQAATHEVQALACTPWLSVPLPWPVMSGACQQPGGPVTGLDTDPIDWCHAGVSCFSGCTPGGGSKCDAAPLLPVLYVSMNLLYNISLLNLLRSAGRPPGPYPAQRLHGTCLHGAPHAGHQSS